MIALGETGTRLSFINSSRLDEMAAAAAASCASLPRLSASCKAVPFPASASSRVAALPLRSSAFLSSPLQISVPSRSGCNIALRRVVIRSMAEKTAPAKKKKEDSAKKRARIAEERRVYNKSRKTEIKTRMKKVFLALVDLKKKGAGSPEDIKPIEILIAEAYSIIDKSIKVGTLHRNTGGNRKSRLARAKKALEIQLGLYTPEPAS